MCVVAELRAVDLRSSHQFEDGIGAASSENGLFFPKTEFSVWTPIAMPTQRIDLVLARGGFGVLGEKLIGNNQLTDLTPSGLWPSDHAGVVAILQLAEALLVSRK